MNNVNNACILRRWLLFNKNIKTKSNLIFNTKMNGLCLFLPILNESYELTKNVSVILIFSRSIWMKIKSIKVDISAETKKFQNKNN
jgi:hypothetical protein